LKMLILFCLKKTKKSLVIKLVKFKRDHRRTIRSKHLILIK
jgi:hypothetical protein